MLTQLSNELCERRIVTVIGIYTMGYIAEILSGYSVSSACCAVCPSPHCAYTVLLGQGIKQGSVLLCSQHYLVQ